MLFFSLQFNYCPLTWMFHSTSLNHKINRLHERCLRVIYKSSEFCVNTPQECTDFSNRNVQVHHGLNSLAYLGPRIWDVLPNNLKRLELVEAFKSRIKGWVPENCPCRIRKPYICQVGFIQIHPNRF